MTTKQPINRQRIRKVPDKFSWIDHRLVRDRHIEYCSHSAAALYLFLLTVSDSQGLSYYSDPSITQRLCMDCHTLLSARRDLVQLNLVAFEKPIYQVLSLDVPLPTNLVPCELLPIEKRLQKIAGGL